MLRRTCPLYGGRSALRSSCTVPRPRWCRRRSRRATSGRRFRPVGAVPVAPIPSAASGTTHATASSGDWPPIAPSFVNATLSSARASPSSAGQPAEQPGGDPRRAAQSGGPTRRVRTIGLRGSDHIETSTNLAVGAPCPIIPSRRPTLPSSLPPMPRPGPPQGPGRHHHRRAADRRVDGSPFGPLRSSSPRAGVLGPASRGDSGP